VQASMFHDLKQSLEAVRSLVDVVASQADRRDEVVSSIILVNHPFFAALRRKMGVPYRFVVETLSEFTEWIKARGYVEELLNGPDDDWEWFRQNKANGTVETVKVDRRIFDEEGKLKPFTVAEWSDNFVSYQVKKISKVSSFASTDDDDIPF
jgi:hypothetical protein